MTRARRVGRRTPSRTTDADLDCALVENKIIFVVPKIRRGALDPPLICSSDQSKSHSKLH